MDAYKKLKTEFDVIKPVINEYTNGTGNVSNHINQLETAIDEKDIENINYCLNEIDLWYQANISDILSNQFVSNKADHERNKKLISEVKDGMLNYNSMNESAQLPKKKVNFCLNTPNIFNFHQLYLAKIIIIINKSPILSNSQGRHGGFFYY